MDWLTKELIISILGGGVLGSLGILAFIKKYFGKFPLKKIKQIIKVVTEFIDFADVSKAAAHPDSPGGEKITKEEWSELYDEGAEFVSAVKELRK